jgi:hypothetical protein
MSDNTTKTYSFTTTATKAAPPFIVLILVQAAKATLHALRINGITDDQLYTAALTGTAGIMAFINWLKNRNKGKIAV